MTEPTTPEAVASWIEERAAATDPFRAVHDASHAHRAAHGNGCTVYPTSEGPFLRVLARAAGERMLEIGTGLGYSSLCMASASNGSLVETIERDPLHAELAQRNACDFGLERNLSILVGNATEVLPSLEGPYDLVFCDADPEQYPQLLGELVRLLRRRGLLVSANLFLGQFDPDIPHLDRLAEYRERLLADDRLSTAFVPGGMALSVRSG